MHSNNLLLCCLIFMLCLPVGWSNLMFSRRSYRFLPDKSIHFKNMTFTKLRSSVKHNFKYQFLKLKSSLATFRQKISEPQTKTNFENILKADNTGINIKVSPGIENSSENPPDAPSPTAPLNRCESSFSFCLSVSLSVCLLHFYTARTRVQQCVIIYSSLVL